MARMSETGRQKLLALYQQLKPEPKRVMRLKALIGDGTNKSTFITVINASGRAGPGGKAWSNQNVNGYLDQLQFLNLLDEHLTCPVLLRHEITVDALAAADGPDLLAAVYRSFPTDGRRPYFHYVMQGDEHAERRLRLALYADDGAEFKRLLDLYNQDYSPKRGPHLLAELFEETPVSLSWLSNRDPNLQFLILAMKIEHLLATGQPTPDLPALLAHYRQQSTDPGLGAIQDLLLLPEILAGHLAEARRILDSLEGEPDYSRLSLRAQIDFLEGRNAEALEGYREGLRRYRKSIGKRKVFLNGSGGLMFLMALFRAGEPALYPEIQAGLEAVNLDITPYRDGFIALQALLWLMQGQEHKARQQLAELRQKSPTEPLSAACLVLVEYLTDPALAAAHVPDTIGRFEAVRELLPLIARINAEVLAQVAKRPEPYQAFLAETAGDPPPLSFIGLVRIAQPWQRQFETLAQALRGTAAKAAAAPAPGRSKRLAWFLDPENRQVDVLEQTTKGRDGWTPGRAVAMKRLHEQDPRLDYLSDHDRRVLRTIRKEVGGWYNEESFYFDLYRTLLALIGHPTLFHAGRREQPLELVPYPVELVVTEHQQGYRFALSHNAEEPTVFLEAEAPGRWRAIDFSSRELALQATLGTGLVVPRQARDQVLALLKEQHLSLPVRAEIAEAELPAVAGQVTPVLQLQPWEEGLKASLVVRPFGAAGPYYLAGQGGQSVLALIEGQHQRAKRDLVAEQAAAATALAALPTLQRSQQGGHEWLISDVESALEFLLEVQACPQPLLVEWPEGEKLRVSAPVSAGQLSLKLSRARDWFQVEGTVAVDEELVLDLQDLLGRLDQARGRFVPLADGRFLALTRQFQAQLARLGGVTEADKKGRRLSPLGTLAVQDLVEDAGTLKADQAWKTFAARLKAAGEYQPELPSTLQADLRDYQLEGFRWLSRLVHWGAGACLADDMGLGKTVQAIALLLEQAPQGPCLVVAPTSVCHNWEHELARFAPTLSVARLGTVREREAQIAALGPLSVLVTSYGLLHQEGERLAGIDWRLVVFDEAQALKNAETKRAQAGQKLKAWSRLALTGTPIENYLDELWSLFNLINPGLLGSRESFGRRFAAPIENQRSDRALQSLRALIRPFILRRTKSAVLSELPPRTEVTLEIELPEDERAFYEALRRRALEALAQLKDSSANGGGQSRIHILAEIMRLRRACCHPGLIDPETALPGAKLETLLELVDELLRNRHKALVFSQFVGQLERVEQALAARGVRCHRLDGSTPPAERERQVRAFQAGEGDLFLISLKAGGTGLNLTAADYVIHLDPWWNPAVEDQASDRAHRIGQQRPVTVYRLIVRDTIEEQILSLHRHKRDLASDLLDGAEMSARLSDDELLELIRR